MAERRSRERDRAFKPIAVLPDSDDKEVAKPPPTFSSTLTDIFNDASTSDPQLKMLLEEDEWVERPQLAKKMSKLTERRSTEFTSERGSLGSSAALMRLRNAQKDEAAVRKRRQRGELCKTDVRAYGTLDQLLSPDWQPPPEIDTQIAGPFDLPQISSSSGPPPSRSSRRRNLVSQFSRTFHAGCTPGSSRRGSRNNDNHGFASTNAFSSSSEVGWGHRRASKNLSSSQTPEGQSRRISVHSRRMSLDKSDELGGFRRRGSVEGSGASRASSSSSFNSSASHRSIQREVSLATREAREMVSEIHGNEVSQDWSLLLNFAHDKAVMPDDDDHPEPTFRTFQDEASAAKQTAMLSAAGERSVAVITQGTTFDSWKDRRGPRPRSPLRPGVYVGHEAAEHASLAQLGKMPAGLPVTADRAFNTGLFPKITTHPMRPVTSDAVVQARKPRESGPSRSIWQEMLSRLEDEGKTAESRTYDAWRRRVVDCTRTMQLEVARFKHEEGQ